MITFEDSVDNKYIRIPLSTFQQSISDDTECKLNIYLLSGASQKVVIGSMFFYNYYALFTNKYLDNGPTTSQHV